MPATRNQAFTLVELLVVISINKAGLWPPPRSAQQHHGSQVK